MIRRKNLFKTCWKCKECLPVASFGSNKSKPDALSTECRVCKRIVDLVYASRNREKNKARARAWYYANPEKAKEANKVINAKWVRANRDKNCAKAGNYRARKLKATPLWLTEDDWRQISIEYALAQWVSEVMKTKYHVDHIVPLKGKTVCGLHVPWNLQVIPATVNIQKGNRIVL